MRREIGENVSQSGTEPINGAVIGPSVPGQRTETTTSAEWATGVKGRWPNAFQRRCFGPLCAAGDLIQCVGRRREMEMHQRALAGAS
jgi:hypothetical protein